MGRGTRRERIDPEGRTARARIGVLGPLRHRDYRLLALGSLGSLFGDGLFLVALPLLVYGISNVPTAMAVVGLVWTGSQLVMLMVGGLASDRLERRKLMIGADLVRALAISAIGVLALTGMAEIWHLMLLGTAVGCANAFFNPAATSIVPDLLPDDELPQANAFLGVARPLMTRLAGPAVGGVVVGAFGPGTAFVVDGATFLASALLLAGIRYRPQAAEVRDEGTTRRLRAGFSFVRRRAWCWVWLVAAAFGLLAVTGPVDMLLPFVLKNDMGLTDSEAAYAFGAILAFGGLGSIVMSLTVSQLALPRRFVTSMYLAEAAGVATLAVYGLMTSVWHGVVAALFLNAMFAYTDIAWTTMLQRLVPRGLLGRVSSLDWMTSLGLLPLSFALAGPLATRFGARVVLLAGAATGSVLILLLMAVPGARTPEALQREDYRAPPGG